MQARASAPVAISIVNAIPSGRGAAIAIDETITASVDLDPDTASVTATIDGVEAIDDTLIRRCVSTVTKRYGTGEGGHIETSTNVPPAVGLKTSSAAANASIMATLAALGEDDAVDPIEATNLAVEVAREVGVTVTGALDDAAASMLGGLVITDNTSDMIIDQGIHAGDVVILIPDSRTPTQSVDVSALNAVAPIAELAMEQVIEGDHSVAMALNGLAVSTALDIDQAAMRRAMTETMAVSPSGTGPAIAAIGSAETCTTIAEHWSDRGDILKTRLRETGVVVH